MTKKLDLDSVKASEVNPGAADSWGRVSFKCLVCKRKIGKGLEFCGETCAQYFVVNEKIKSDNLNAVAEHSVDTEFLMKDGRFKKALIVVGDEIMGEDSKPVKILGVKKLGLKAGYDIVPTKGDSFRLSVDSLITVRVSPRDNGALPVYLVMSVAEYLNKSPKFKGRAQLYRSEGVDFGVTNEALEIPPYILGLWLGDGSSNMAALTTMDNEIKEAWCDYGKSLGMQVSTYEKKAPFGVVNKAKTYLLKVPKVKTDYKFSGMFTNQFTHMLDKMGIWKNKEIPLLYKLSSIKRRRELIAGLIDTDGSLGNGMFDFVNKNKKIVEDMVFIIRSLGLAGYMKECKKSCKNSKDPNHVGIYYRFGISGNLDTIPTRIPNKQANPRMQVKSVLVSHINLIKTEPSQFLTFTVENKDAKVLLSDFTIVKI